MWQKILRFLENLSLSLALFQYGRYVLYTRARKRAKKYLVALASLSCQENFILFGNSGGRYNLDAMVRNAGPSIAGEEYCCHHFGSRFALVSHQANQ